jgi:hypothetical protein
MHEEHKSLNGTVHAENAVIKSSIVLESRQAELAPLLTPLDDTLEWEAHASILERLGLHREAAYALRTHS